jgi:hypothetical protein
MRWGNLGAGPDGVPWASSAAPHSLISYVGSDGRTYALALRNDQLLLARFDLAKFASLTPIQSGADANQVDPAVKLSDGTYVVTYTPLQ